VNTCLVTAGLLLKSNSVCYIYCSLIVHLCGNKTIRCTATQDKEMLDYRFPTALQMVLSVAMAEQMGKTLYQRDSGLRVGSESQFHSKINGPADP
jgi:hypothetical protein